MEIIIGSMPPLAAQAEKTSGKSTQLIEARLLNVRKPRKGIAGPSGMERREKSVKDPLQGRVLTIMVPDANQLPSDIDSANYTMQVRFIRK